MKTKKESPRYGNVLKRRWKMYRRGNEERKIEQKKGEKKGKITIEPHEKILERKGKKKCSKEGMKKTRVVPI